MNDSLACMLGTGAYTGGVTGVQSNAPFGSVFYYILFPGGGARLLVREVGNIRGNSYPVYGKLTQLFLRKEKGVPPPPPPVIFVFPSGLVRHHGLHPIPKTSPLKKSRVSQSFTCSPQS